MSKFYSLLLLFTTVTLTTATTATSVHQLSSINSSSPAPSPSNHSSQPPPVSKPSPPPQSPSSPSPSQRLSPEYMQQQQLKNIIDALIGAGDFAAWANILFNPLSNASIPTSTNAALIPTTATMFVPGNDALARLSATATGAYSFDPFIIPYHILPQRLTFSDLQMFKTLTRIPTLLPSKTVVITSNAPSNFTIDDSLITQPDIYTNAAVCVHGIANVLDYKVYGDAGRTPPTIIPPPPLPPLPPADETVTPPPEVVSSTTGVSLVDFLITFIASVLIQYVIN